MPTIHVTPLPEKTTWQEFELLTLHGMQLKWESPMLQGEGRPGQRQDGVDISGLDYLGRPVAIQCKKFKDTLKLDVVKKEIQLAESFVGKLSCLYIATSADRDAKLQREVRVLSEERVKKDKFGVGLIYWDDIFTGLLMDQGVLCSHFPYLKYPEIESKLSSNANQIAALTLGYYGRFLWRYLELMFGEFGWMAGQDPEESRTVIRIVRNNCTIATKDVETEIFKWTTDIETQIFDATPNWDKIKVLARRVEDRVKNISFMNADQCISDFLELGMSIGFLGWVEEDFSGENAKEISKKMMKNIPSSVAKLPELVTSLVGKDCYKAAPVIVTFALRELRWPSI